MPGIDRRSCIGRDGKLQSKEKNICMQIEYYDAYKFCTTNRICKKGRYAV